MNQIIDNETLSSLKLRQWEDLSRNLPASSKESFKDLLKHTQKNNLVTLAREKDIAVPLLLSMIIDLKGEIEHLEDLLELQRVRSFGI